MSVQDLNPSEMRIWYAAPKGTQDWTPVAPGMLAADYDPDLLGLQYWYVANIQSLSVNQGTPDYAFFRTHNHIFIRIDYK